MELQFTSEEIWGAWEEIKVGLETANQFYETDMYADSRIVIQKLLEAYVRKVLKEGPSGRGYSKPQEG
jgi:hypothetical protein